MKLINRDGFTIIETMLFLGISALLITGILVGTGTSINNQRYRDSVSSLQSFFRQQYSEVSNVDNDRLTMNECNGEIVAIGQSDCVILGKFLTVNDINNSNEIVSKTVIGITPSGINFANNDIDSFKQYNISISSLEGQTYKLEWGASLVDIADNHNKPIVFSMLILRSPLSGVIRTFVHSNNSSPIGDGNIVDILTEAGSIERQTKLCINSNGLFTGPKSAVIIMPNATGPSGIETLGESSGC